MSSMFSPAILDALKKLGAGGAGITDGLRGAPDVLSRIGPQDMPRMGGIDEARILANGGEDPVAESRRLLNAETPAPVQQIDEYDPAHEFQLPVYGPSDPTGMGPRPYSTSRNMPRMSNVPTGSILGGGGWGGMGGGAMPMPQQAKGGWKSRLLHAGQGALMGLANARRNPTNPNDWGAVVGSAIGGGAAGAISPQSIENEKYYERDLPRWYEQQKMASDLSNKDRMQRMTEAQIENLRTDNERAQKEFEQRKTEFGQKQQTKALEDWDWFGDPKKPLSAADATRRGLPAEFVGQTPSGGKRTGKNLQPLEKTAEGLFERMPDGSLKPVMSLDTRTNPVRSAAFSGITTGEAPHQLQPYSAPKTPSAPHTINNGQLMWNEQQRKYVPTPGYIESPEKRETGNERRIRERQDRQDATKYMSDVQSADKSVADAQAEVTRIQGVLAGNPDETGLYINRHGHKVTATKGALKDAQDALDAAHDARLAAQQRAEDSGLVKLDSANEKDTGKSKKRNPRPVVRAQTSSGSRRSIDEVKAQARADVKNMGETPQAKKAFKDAFGEDY